MAREKNQTNKGDMADDYAEAWNELFGTRPWAAIWKATMLFLN